MSTCTYCGESAGLFHSSHKACEEEHQRKIAEKERRSNEWGGKLTAAMKAYLDGTESLDDVHVLAYAAKNEAAIDDLPSALAARTLLLISDRYVTPMSPPGPDVEKRVGDLIERFGISTDLLDANRTWTQFVMLCAILDCELGVLPKRVKFEGVLPFAFESGERLVWAFPHAQYLVDKVVRSRTPGYAGVSVRVMSGLYVRSGASTGHTQVTEGLVKEDEGLFAITDRALYFSGQHQSVKVKLRDIISFESYSDGVGFCKAGASARKQVFVTRDKEGWFPYLLAKKIAEKGSNNLS